MNYNRNPFNRFFKLETSGSIVLILATLAALIIANSPLGDSYQAFWHKRFTLSLGNFTFSETFIHLINDGLMAVFFFVIGLEIKREILVGELNNLKKATLPIFGAIGGMLIPVALFFGLQGGKAGVEGWGIPMATDIAFTLGILKLLGNKVPLGLKVFLTAFAIVDDIGAVLVIAIFYSSGIAWNLILIAGLLILTLAILSSLRFYSKYLYFIISVVVWLLFLESGIHPTIAGVLLAFTIPVQRKCHTQRFYRKMSSAIEEMKAGEDDIPEFLTSQQRGALETMERLTTRTISPLQHLEHSLHGWVTYLIMPIFAFANAGVALSGEITGLSWNIAASMLFGKTIGIFLFAMLAVKLKLAQLPERVKPSHIIGVGLLGGLGFTMALFISSLAYGDALMVDGAKTGILIGSLSAGILGYLLLKFTLRNNIPETEEEED